MRTVLMVGTALAQAPYAVGRRAHVPELLAYNLALTGELAYVNPADQVSAAGAALLQAQQRQSALMAWGNVYGSVDYESPGAYVAKPSQSQARVRGTALPGRLDGARYG